MANIGSFKKVGNDFQGEIVTLSLQAKGVRIVAETNRSNDNAPSHRVYVGRAEIGAAWSKRSEEGRDYLSLKLDDPSLQRADLREPVRRRGRRRLHPALVAAAQERRVSQPPAKPRPSYRAGLSSPAGLRRLTIRADLGSSPLLSRSPGSTPMLQAICSEHGDAVLNIAALDGADVTGA